ncbi:Multifunctional conjugation protein TraI [Polystyrenella longa]|uniref:Multifunctional conjugation protein TraI n=1 Tax=Polystyrenella longa TaxID=2528007 RepID=A0A518CNE2_9PLAN|nr:MobF family relaxase [Polystyrenella longa]QDU80733.1 Multifunctional conjugation protein TraI [Polystyrenella longa]
MLTMTQAKSITGTEKYFDTVLTQGDYFCSDAEVNGTWNGKGAAILGLSSGSVVTKQEFKALLSGNHPVTGKKLVQRLRKDRRPGVDLTFSIPKSVSLVWAINRDETILDALREAVKETMTRDVEPLMCRRVRAGDKAASKERVQTGNLIYADFLHKTSRPVNGQVDAHLHIHAFVMNQTSHAGKHYAAELEEIFRQRLSLQAKFEARFARILHHKLGYEVEKVRFLQSGRMKAGWEIKRIDRATIEKFSSRTQQIESFAEEHGIAEPAAKGKLGVRTREKKERGSTVEQLREEWVSRLTLQEQETFQSLRDRNKAENQDKAATVEASLRYALEHHLYRQSTVEKQTVIGTALEHGLTLLPEELEAALQTETILHGSQEIRGAKRDFITTREVLDAETRMIGFAREGRGTRMTMARKEHQFKRDWLNSAQKNAVRHVLNSRDTVMAVTGGAGTGKSSLMEEAAEAIRSNGKEVFVFAPSTGAREVLEEKGFENAQTVEHLLRNEKLHSELKDQVLWIDEAGLLDVRAMNGIFAIAKQQNARVVLSGDTRQHASPRRGEAMRLLEAKAGLDIARVETIQRQKDRYKKAVELISQGHTIVDPQRGLSGMVAGFDLLDRMGKVKEIGADQRYDVLAKQYLKSLKKKQSTLIVAPTHAEGRAVTEHIRERLRKKGAIGLESVEFSRLQSLNWSEAEKSEASSYDQAGLVVQFHQNVKGGYKRGERYRVCRDTEGKAALTPLQGGPLKPIPREVASRFEVYEEVQTRFSVGDKIRFTLGGKATDHKRRISNGRLDEITGFDRHGDLKLKSGMTVSRHYGHWDLGYVVTSHASQGKDRDVAIAAIGSQSLPAVNAKQFYVTVSRGREEVTIYVDDKAAVRRAIQNAGEQLTATEMMQGTPSPIMKAARQQHQRQRFLLDRVHQWWRARFPNRERSQTQSNNIPFQSSPELSRS